MLGAILTDPVSDSSAFGILFLHAGGLFDGCGDSTFCAAAAAIETGRVEVTEPITKFSIDTVNGPIHIEADVQAGRVAEVRFENVPSYLIESFTVSTPNLKDITIDTAFGGLYFAFVDAASAKVELDPSNEKTIVSTALEIWKAIDRKGLGIDPHRSQRYALDLVTFIQNVGENWYKVGNVYQPGRMGRTPSGTGTGAHMALRHVRGELSMTTPFIHESVVGMKFRGQGMPVSTKTGEVFIPTIGAKSYLMGVHQFYVDKDDPFATGFALGE